MSATTRDYVVRIDGKLFRCECGCNVFRKPDPEHKPKLFCCNSCGAHWVGE